MLFECFIVELKGTCNGVIVGEGRGRNAEPYVRTLKFSLPDFVGVTGERYQTNLHVR